MNGTQVTPGGGGARADISDRATAAIRPVDPAEQAALSDFFAALSVESRYRRFFAPVRPSHGLLDLLSGRPANVDAIVAIADGVIVGHGPDAAVGHSPDGLDIHIALPPARPRETAQPQATAWPAEAVGKQVRPLVAVGR